MISDKAIWILEDEENTQFVYREILELRYRLFFFQDLASLRAALSDSLRARPDLLVADLRLPGQSFLSFLISPEGALLKSIPFLVVSSVDDVDASRACFANGALDYLTKPFAKAELLVKLERLLANAAIAQHQSAGSVRMDSITLSVSRGEEPQIPLTPKEFQIVSLLMSSPNRTALKEKVIERIWGETAVDNKTLAVHLSLLRKKLSQIRVSLRSSHSDSLELILD